MNTEGKIDVSKEINEITKPVINVTSELEKISKRFFDFQLQLIIMAGATFSIYIALRETTPTSIVKYGFLFLAGSLFLGLLSVISSISHGYFNGIFEFVNFERKLFDKNKSEEFKKTILETGYEKPIIVDLDAKLFSTDNGISVWKFMNKIFVSGFEITSIICGLGQLLFFLVSIILLLISIFKL